MISAAVGARSKVNGGTGLDSFSFNSVGKINTIDGGAENKVVDLETGTGTFANLVCPGGGAGCDPADRIQGLGTKYNQDPPLVDQPRDNIATFTSNADFAINLQPSGISQTVMRGSEVVATLTRLDFASVVGTGETVVDLTALAAFEEAPTIISVDGGGDGGLLIKGTPAADFIVIRDGTVEVNAGEFEVSGAAEIAPFQVKDLKSIEVWGLGGDDIIINKTSIPSLLIGGDGKDVLKGGEATDLLFGGDGTDSLYGNGGLDYVFGDQDVVSICALPRPNPAP